VKHQRVLLTGSSGYIGRALVRALLEDDQIEDLVGVDVRPPKSRQSRMHFVNCDVRDPLDETIRRHRINTILHAAFVVRPSHNRSAALYTNVEAMRQVLHSAAACKVDHLVHLSSATVYGFAAHPDTLFRETDAMNPHSGFHYAEHKSQAETLVEATREAGSIPCITVLRPSFVVGRGSDNPLFEHLGRRLVSLPTEMSPMQLTHMDDLTRAVKVILSERAGGTFNIGSAGSLSALEMVERLHGRAMLVPVPVLRAVNSVAWGLRLKSLTNVPSSAVALLQRPWRVSGERFEQQFAFRYHYDSVAAFEAFARELAARRYASRFSS
jgi:UDP-glucose 4-epimerase